MTRNPTPGEQAGREVSLTDFLLRMIAIDEDRHAFRDLAEAFRAQGQSSLASFMEEQEARVLAECEAKRRIVEIVPTLGGHWNPDAGRIAPSILRALAAVYSDHPDYREEWRP